MRCIVLPWVYKANKQIDMPAKTKTLQTSTILGPNPSSQFVANSPLCFPQLCLQLQGGHPLSLLLLPMRIRLNPTCILPQAPALALYKHVGNERNAPGTWWVYRSQTAVLMPSNSATFSQQHPPMRESNCCHMPGGTWQRADTLHLEMIMH
jgi:hypothetical protein